MLPETPQLHFPSPYMRPTIAPARAQRTRMDDGARIASFVYGDSSWSNQPETAVVVFIHGNGEEHGIFGPTIDAVSAAGNPALGIDSRAQGHSTRGTKHLTYELFEADVVNVLAAYGIERFHVVGFSDGGIVALLLARDYPERVLSCTAIGANLSPDGVAADDWDIEGTIERLKTWSIWAKSLDEDGEICPQVLTPSAEEASVTAELLNLMQEEPHIDPHSLSSIICPTTIMAGEFDVILPEETQRIAHAIPGAELIVVAEHGHTLPKETPDEVTRVVFQTMVRSCQDKD